MANGDVAKSEIDGVGKRWPLLAMRPLLMRRPTELSLLLLLRCRREFKRVGGTGQSHHMPATPAQVETDGQ